MNELLPCPFCGGEAHTYKTIAQRYCAICNEPFCANVGPFDTEAEAIVAWNTRATGGTLTAEQVRESWCGNLKRDCLYDPPTPDWQAIADELNSRAERTCEMRADGAHCMNGVEFYECRSCGEYACVPTAMGKSEPPNYCPNCGAKVVGE